MKLHQALVASISLLGAVALHAQAVSSDSTNATNPPASTTTATQTDAGANTSTSAANRTYDGSTATPSSSSAMNTTSTTDTSTTTTTGATASTPTYSNSSSMPAPDASSTTTYSSTPSTTQTMATQGMDMNYPRWEADVEAAYAFRLRTTGIIADIGANVSPMHFLGFEYSHFQPTGSSTDAVAGRINSKEDINTYEFAYRFRMPLAQFAQNGMVSPVDFYAGISGGVGTVRLRTTVPGFGFSSRSEDDGVLSGSATAGLQWNIDRNWGIKAGYRYIYMHHVNLYGTRGNIDTSVVEAGLNFRW